MQPLVSVIVPIYNTEKYLPRCIDSLCRQSLQGIEILLIDDASTDHCGEICESYAQKDSRIRVFHHKENKGPGAARNLGIENATGDWLMFVDSDDWVHEDYCKAPYECAIKNNADLVIFGYARILNSGSGKSSTITLPNGYKTPEKALELIINGKASNGPCNKIYTKLLFNNERFPEGTFYEDAAVIYKVVWNAKHVYCLDKTLYCYCYRSGSTTTKHTNQMLNDHFKVFKQQYCDLSNWGYDPQKLDALLKNTALTYCMRKSRTRDHADPNYIFCANVLHSCKTLPKDFTWKRKVLFVLFNYCPSIFEIICNLYGKKILHNTTLYNN